MSGIDRKIEIKQDEALRQHLRA